MSLLIISFALNYKTMNSKNITFVVIIVAIILGLFLFNSSLKKEIIDVPVYDIESTEDRIVSISVPDQVSEDSVFIENVYVLDDSYVSIQRQGSAQSAMLGVSELLHEGEKSNFRINVSEKTITGETLTAVLYVDNGDGVFDVSSDVPATDIDGDIMLVKFKVVGVDTFKRGIKL